MAFVLNTCLINRKYNIQETQEIQVPLVEDNTHNESAFRQISTLPCPIIGPYLLTLYTRRISDFSVTLYGITYTRPPRVSE